MGSAYATTLSQGWSRQMYVKSLTGAYIAGEREIPTPLARRPR